MLLCTQVRHAARVLDTQPGEVRIESEDLAAIIDGFVEHLHSEYKKTDDAAQSASAALDPSTSVSHFSARSPRRLWIESRLRRVRALSSLRAHRAARQRDGA